MRKLFFLLAMIALACGGYTVYKKRVRVALWWQLQAPLADWASKQIEQDFAPFATITQEALDETFQKASAHSSQIYRYRIEEGQIRRSPQQDLTGRAAVFDRILTRLNKAKRLPSVDFIVSMDDGMPEASHDFWITPHQAPVLAWAKRKELAPYVVLIPDFLTTRESSWHVDIDTINQKYKTLPWEKRKGAAFWRGASNDKGYTLSNYAQKPRFLISAMSKEHPDLVNAGFCRVYPADVEALFTQMGIILGNVSIAGHLDYKYLPVIDGYMCTFPGFQWRLLSGSLTLKQESDEIQYFYGALKPHEHYLPLRNDLSDLLEKIAWAKEHDAECRQMAENARAFALQNLLPESIYAYLYHVLQKYAALQDF
jgi:hypothetical protein